MYRKLASRDVLVTSLAMAVVATIILAAAPARAQTYDPKYPVCLQTYGRDGNYIACRYTSPAQCRLSASDCVIRAKSIGGGKAPISGRFVSKPRGTFWETGPPTVQSTCKRTHLAVAADAEQLAVSGKEVSLPDRTAVRWPDRRRHPVHQYGYWLGQRTYP
jgi:hypothetical protein